MTVGSTRKISVLRRGPLVFIALVVLICGFPCRSQQISIADPASSVFSGPQDTKTLLPVAQTSQQQIGTITGTVIDQTGAFFFNRVHGEIDGGDSRVGKPIRDLGAQQTRIRCQIDPEVLFRCVVQRFVNKVGRSRGSPPVGASTRQGVDSSQSIARRAVSSVMPFTRLSYDQQ